MSAFRFRVVFLALVALLFLDRAPPLTETGKEASRSPASPAIAASALAKMPVRFEENVGQFADSVRFVARRGATTLTARDDGATVVLHAPKLSPKNNLPLRHRTPVVDRGESVALELKVDGGRTVAPVAGERLATKTNYVVGRDRSKWHTDVPTYGKVTYPGVRDGVDLVYHGENGSLEYDFVVAPGARVDSVAMSVSGADSMKIEENGDLTLHTSIGDLRQPPPVAYQLDARGRKQTVASKYKLVGGDKVAFEVPTYDHDRALVIDPFVPVIGFATFLGGTGSDQSAGVAADGAGNTYVTGYAFSGNFPGTPVESYGCCGDAIVAKLDTAGQLAWATYLSGGEGFEMATTVAVAGNEVYVAGLEDSGNFPVSDPPFNDHFSGTEAFVVHLAGANGQFIAGTLLSGSLEEAATGIAVDGNGNVYVGGQTNSNDFTNPEVQQRLTGPAPGPGNFAVPNGINNSYAAFVVKLNPQLSALVYGPALVDGPGTDLAYALALDSNNRAYITGETSSAALPLAPSCDSAEGSSVLVARLNTAGTAWDYQRCIGGSDHQFGTAIAVNASFNAYVVGGTTSGNFPTLNGFQMNPPGGGDGFVFELSPDGASTVFSSYLGGETSQDYANTVALDAAGSVWIGGFTNSPDFPTVDPIQPFQGGGGGGPKLAEGPGDAFITRVAANGGSLLFSTFYGGNTGTDEATGIAIVGSSIHFLGTTNSTALLTANPFQTNNAGQEDLFVAKISVPPLLISPPTLTIQAGGTQQFTAIGGAGSGYVFTVVGGSGGTITPQGLYTAGNTTATDTVTVTDATGLTANATVNVRGSGTTVPLGLNPTSATVPPRGTRTFTATGGTLPYAFSFASNASGGTLFNGAYTAGSRGGVIDIVRVTDGAGETLTATVSVTAGITITPAAPSAPPGGSVNFTATGGSGVGFLWSISKNSSSGSIDPSTGRYTGGNNPNSVDTVQVVDSLGNRATVNVSVGGGIAINPDEPSTTPRGRVEFSATGGAGGFTWAMVTSASGGTIDPSTGAYVAGSVGAVVDVIRVTDAAGKTASTQITVGPSLSLTPTNSTVVSGAKVNFSATGGSGVGYAWAITTNPSGGNITDQGVYTAGNAAGTDTVRLTDSLGNTADGTVVVTAAPPAGNTPGGGVGGVDGGSFNGINIGGGGDDDCSCEAVGASSTGTGSAGRMLAGLAVAVGLALRRQRRRRA